MGITRITRTTLIETEFLNFLSVFSGKKNKSRSCEAITTFL